MEPDNYDTSTILITGGTGKLGRIFLRGFSTRGWAVAFTSRNVVAAEKLRDECIGWGASQVHVIEADLSRENGVHSIVSQLQALDFMPTVIVNNARSLDTLDVGSDGIVTATNWIGEFRLGVVAAYELTMACARLSRPPKRVINVASMYGITAANLTLYETPNSDSPINYGVVKAALIHLTKELAVRLSPNILVNAISYGGVSGRASEDFKSRYSKLCPAGRMLIDDDVFGPMAFLSGSGASGMTGHNLVVDGGWTIW